MAPSVSALLTQWHWEPSVLIGLVLLAGAYHYAIGPWRRRHDLGPPATHRQVTYFWLGTILLLLSLVSPLDEIGDTYLFSGHMVQHLLLATLWPPLLLMAVPAWLARALLRLPGASLWRFFTYPAVAVIFFNLDIYVWHIPYLYDLTLRSEPVHIVEHLTFMIFGVFNWWPVLAPTPEERLSAPWQVLYLVADGMFMMVLGIVFTFAPVVLYTPYAGAPRLWGISAQTDQQIGGLIMWYPGNLPYAVLLIAAFYRWFDAGGPASSAAPTVTQHSPTAGPPVT